MNLLSPNKSKAIGGGGGAAVGYIASGPVAENLSIIIMWLLSFAGDVPDEVEAAITWIIGALVVLAIGYVGAYFAPPNAHSYFLREKEKGV